MKMTLDEIQSLYFLASGLLRNYSPKLWVATNRGILTGDFLKLTDTKQSVTIPGLNHDLDDVSWAASTADGKISKYLWGIQSSDWRKTQLSPMFTQEKAIESLPIFFSQLVDFVDKDVPETFTPFHYPITNATINGTHFAFLLPWDTDYEPISLTISKK